MVPYVRRELICFNVELLFSRAILLVLTPSLFDARISSKAGFFRKSSYEGRAFPLRLSRCEEVGHPAANGLSK
jgi:hypothetical protein